MNRKQSLASLSEAADNIEDNDDIEYHVHQMDSDRAQTILESSLRTKKRQLDLIYDSDNDDQSKVDDEHVLDLRCELFESIPEPLNRPKSYQKLIITDSDEPGDPDDALACTKLNACLSLRKKWISQHPAPPQDIIKTFDDVEHGTSLVAGEIKRLRSASVGMIPIHKLPKISTAPGSPSILSPRTHLATNSGSHDGEIMHLSRPHSELYLSPHPTTQTESELEIQALNTTTNTSTNATTSTLQISQRKDKGSTNNLTILPSLDSASVGGAALGPTDLHPDMLRRRFRPNYCIFERPILDRNMHGKSIKMIDGVIHVISIETDTPTFTVLPFSEFLQDYNMVRDCVHSGPVTSYSYMRLELLAAKFDLYLLLNSKREIDSQKAVPHRDFYNVRKVDTHVHHSACMNQKHLLRFIKHKLRVLPNEVVTFRDGKNLTLGEVFQSLGLTAYELSIDTLDMHAHDTFHRFDRFNLKYNPAGQSRLREIFLKTDNLIEGRYLADITKEVMKDLEASKYQLAEWRVSIYGRNINEWTKLAKWFYVNKLAHPNIRWLIQVPRLYQLYRASNEISSFAEMLHNIFHPLFEATLNPQDHVEITYFLQTIVGFDSVDDESRPEFGQLSQGSHSRGLSTPEEWKFCENPPYGYWMYYMYANICTLNQLRASRNMPTFQFRPHCGEAGDVDHLVSTFLLADQINHGILLRKNPGLQYLYYLTQIGIAMSPLSNNKLFLDYHKNPFIKYFRQGMNVSLSTDDPLMLHYTKDALVEEYSVATQVWKLSSADQCEIARNSVLQSGWEARYKLHFLGADYTDIRETNVPDIRLMYRQETLNAELQTIQAATVSK